MILASVATSDQFFAKLPRKADLVAVSSDGVNAQQLFGAFDAIILEWHTGSSGVPLNDSRLADALVVSGASVGA